MADKVEKQGGSAIVLHGTVVSGLGEGRYFMSQSGYAEQMRKLLGFTPYEGTLNIKVAADELHKVEEMKSAAGMEISGFDRSGKHFGGATLYLAELSGVKCAVVVPKISRHHDTIELIAKDRLRDSLGLSDGSDVTLSVFPEK